MGSGLIQRCALYVFAGVMISIAMAWGCALWDKGPDSWIMKLRFVDDRHGGFIRTTFGTSIVEVMRSESVLERDANPSMNVRLEPRSWAIAPAVRFVERTTAEPPAYPDAVFAYGWPYRCLWARFTETPQGDFRVTDDEWGIVVGERHYWPPLIEVVLAVRPLWLGLLVNALLYGTLVALLHCLWVCVQRTRRCGRGLCTSCSYDLSGAKHTDCPECGVPCAGA